MYWIAVLFTFFAAVCICAAQAKPGDTANDNTASIRAESPEIRPPAPDFRLPARDGIVRTLKDYRGKWLLLNFWATWCPPCREEIPALSAAQEKWGAKGVAIVGVSMDAQGWRTITPFLIRYPARYEIVLGNPKVARAYGAGRVYPTTVVIDPEGRMGGTITTALEAKSLDALLGKLLPKSADP